MPGIELRRRVGAEEKGELAAGLPLAKLAEGVDRIGWTGSFQLGLLDRETRLIAQGQRQHGRPVLRGGAVAAALEWLLAGRHQPERLQAEHLPGNLRDDQVAVVNRIERAAEQADHGPSWRRPNPPGTLRGAWRPRGESAGCSRRPPACLPCTPASGTPAPASPARRGRSRRGGRWRPRP